MIGEYETTEQFEMAYLYYLGYPHEFDRATPGKIIMIVKGDVPLIKSQLIDWWECNTRVDGRTMLNCFKAIKQSLWVGGRYDPVYAKKREINNGDSTRGTADKQKK